MDILIRGMEMPTNKFGKVLLIYPNGEAVVSGGTKYEAIPVPPHGRCIDADVLLKKCEFVCTDDDVDVRAVRHNVIEAAPTIIPASGGK